MKTPEQFPVPYEKRVADLEVENKALRERLKKAEMAVAILRDALKKRDRCEDCGGKGFSYVEIEGEAEPDPCECSRWADLVIESTATIDGITKIGEGWIPPCEASALRERAEAAQASFKERDLQMRAALEETESMFQRTQRAEAIIVALHQLVGEKLTANPANIQDAVERLIQAKEKAEALLAATSGVPSSPTWPLVLEFARRMEAKLAMNRHKGDRKGWIKDSPRHLLNRLYDEADELSEAIQSNQSPNAVAYECADVANFAMMVADSYQHSKKA